MNIDDVMEDEQKAYRALFTYLGISLDDVLATDIYLKQQVDFVADEIYYVLSFQVIKYNSEGYTYVEDGDLAQAAISLKIPFETIEKWREDFNL